MEDTEEYQAGYDVGHSDGYDEGREEGYATGFDEGKQRGHDEGFSEGQEDICDNVESRLNYGAASAVGC